MCGIFGHVGDAEVEQTYELGFWSQVRGTDAGGLLWLNEGHNKYCAAKRPGPVTNHVIPEYAHALESPILLGHTRLATSGPAHINENNHPHVGDRFALVHNGHVYNDYNWRTVMKTGCDSEAIVHALQEKKVRKARTLDCIEHAMGETRGATTVAMIDKEQDDRAVWLWRDDGHSLYVAKTKRAFFFASEKFMLECALGSKAEIEEVPNYTAVRIDSKTMKCTAAKIAASHKEYKSTGYYGGYSGYAHDYDPDTWDGWAHRSRRGYVSTGDTSTVRVLGRNGQWETVKDTELAEHLAKQKRGNPRVHTALPATPEAGIPWPDTQEFADWHIGNHIDTMGCDDYTCGICNDAFGSWRAGSNAEGTGDGPWVWSEERSMWVPKGEEAHLRCLDKYDGCASPEVCGSDGAMCYTTP